MHTIAFLALFLFCVISTANAHMYLNSVFLNGAETKSPVRKHPANQYDYPLSDKVSQRFSSTPDLICGWPPALDTKSDSKLSVAAGQQVFLQWWHASVGDDVVDGSHKGPCSVYMAKSEDGKGAVWFKVYEEGWNPTTKEWCTDRIRKDNAADGKGRVKVTIPSNLQAGNYLVRSEFWALHEGYTAFGAQPYVGCLEVTVTGSGNVSPNNNLINFEGYYKSSDPGLLYNIYSKSDFSDYNSVIPGGRVNAQLSGGSGTPSTTGSTNPTTTPTTTPGTSPTTTPGTCSTNQCQSGAVGCSCGNDAKKSCDRGLSCHAATNLCLPLECETGSEKCICTQGGACDAGLTCFSNLCVKVTKNTDAAIDADSSSSSLSFSALSIFLGAAVAALGL